MNHLVEEFVKANPEPKKTPVAGLFRLGANSPGEFDQRMRQAYKSGVKAKRPLSFAEGWEEFWIGLLHHSGLVSDSAIKRTRFVWVQDESYQDHGRHPRQKSILMLRPDEDAYPSRSMYHSDRLKPEQLRARANLTNYLKKYPFVDQLKPYFAMLHVTLNLMALKDLAELRLAIMQSTLESQEYLKTFNENH